MMKENNNFLKVVFYILFTGVFTFSQTEYFSEKNFRKNLFYLGSDVFEGRGTGSLGGYLAAKYLAYKFSEYGLLPAGDDGTFYQNIQFHSSFPLSGCDCRIFIDSLSYPLVLWDDYVMAETGEQTYIPESVKIIFAGYGIVAPEYDYNDYQYYDVENKIVVFLEGEPQSETPEYFNGRLPSVYSYNETKEKIAIARGAKGCIVLPNKNKQEFNWEKIKNVYSFEDINPAFNPAGNFNIILNPEKAELLFENCSYSYEDVLRMEEFGALKSFPLHSKFSFKGIFHQKEVYSANIIGLLPGSDKELKNTYVIVSAHYDHLGIGQAVNSDSIYNGVFDNAMGVSAVLELTRIISNSKYQPKRSVIFLLTTAEEKGLLGSLHYVKNPVFPLHKTIANINIDGIASFDEFKSVIGVGAELSGLGDILETIAKNKNLKMAEIPPEFSSYEAFNKSDQVSFALAGIPSILILDAPDYVNISREDALNKFIIYDKFVYHTPFDDLNLPINYKAVNQHFNLLYNFIIEIANSENQPEWKEGTPYLNERLRTIAEKR